MSGTAGSTYTGEELEKALRDQSIATPEPAFVGMAKASEKAGYIAFTLGSCETAKWVHLPADAIAKAQQVGTMPCRDHSHPLVRITLASAKDEATQAIAALLSQAVAIDAIDRMRAIPGMYAGRPMASRMPVDYFGIEVECPWPGHPDCPKWPDFMRGFHWRPRMHAGRPMASRMPVDYSGIEVECPWPGHPDCPKWPDFMRGFHWRLRYP